LLLGAAAASALRAQPDEKVTRLPRRVRLALLGLDGHYGEILDPLPRLPDVEIAAVSDPDERKVAQLVRAPGFSSARAYTDYRRMLDGEHLDLVAVCNNNGERAAAILACVERKLHVIAEKPLATERADLDRVKEAVTRSGVRLSMLLPMRFTSPYLALQRIVSSGEIGEVAQIGAQKSYKAGERPAWMRRRATYGGTLPWIGIHMVDLMRWASGRDFTEVASFETKIGDFPGIGEMENSTATLFRMDNTGVATLRMDYLRPETAPSHGDDRLRLAGTRGIAEYQPAIGVTLVSAGRSPELVRDLPPDGSVFVDFVESVWHNKPSALSLADIYRNCEIVLAARAAAEQHRILKL
jgi:predicted dehydrogenase